MGKLSFLRQAAEEAEAAAPWYEQERSELGTEFDAAVDAALDLIEDGLISLSPMPGTSGTKGAKRLILRRFPYDIVVLENSGEIIVIVFAHHSRKPGDWRDRISP